MRVLIVDDQQVVRAGVRALLEADSEIEVCGEAIDGRDAIAKALDLMPDVVVMDISMPNLGGIEATRQLVLLAPQIRVVILSLHDFPHIMQQALNAGAFAYVVKFLNAGSFSRAVCNSCLTGGRTATFLIPATYA